MIDTILEWMFYAYLIGNIPFAIFWFAVGIKAPGSWDVWYWKVPDIIFCYLWAMCFWPWAFVGVIKEEFWWPLKRKLK